MEEGSSGPPEEPSDFDIQDVQDVVKSSLANLQLELRERAAAQAQGATAPALPSHDLDLIMEEVEDADMDGAGGELYAELEEEEGDMHELYPDLIEDEGDESYSELAEEEGGELYADLEERDSDKLYAELEEREGDEDEADLDLEGHSPTVNLEESQYEGEPEQSYQLQLQEVEEADERDDMAGGTEETGTDSQGQSRQSPSKSQPGRNYPSPSPSHLNYLALRRIINKKKVAYATPVRRYGHGSGQVDDPEPSPEIEVIDIGEEQEPAAPEPEIEPDWFFPDLDLAQMARHFAATDRLLIMNHAPAIPMAADADEDDEDVIASFVSVEPPSTPYWTARRRAFTQGQVEERRKAAELAELENLENADPETVPPPAPPPRLCVNETYTGDIQNSWHNKVHNERKSVPGQRSVDGVNGDTVLLTETNKKMHQEKVQIHPDRMCPTREETRFIQS